ncbi:winged helix-turn-helix domain-containing protein [Streptomyces noursei]|uniref:winged helix-turn-helix domain-containing protein n=1 Tax=Streptomyces noursei TaxID=1971 RepID=UPI0038291D3F
MSFPTNLLLNSVERLAAVSPNTTGDGTRRGVAHVQCDTPAAPRVRARLAQAFTGPDIRLTDLAGRSGTAETTHLEAAFATHGPVTAALTQLLSLVWLEPAVSSLHWHLDQHEAAHCDRTDTPQAPVHTVHDLVVDLGCRCVSIDGRRIRLTGMEFELLAHFIAHPRQFFSHDRLMELVWQQSAPHARQTLARHVTALRQKLGTRYGAIITTTPDGYLCDPAAPAL